MYIIAVYDMGEKTRRENVETDASLFDMDSKLRF